MFKYTRAALNIIVDNIKLFAKIFKYGTLVLSFAYYVLAIIFQIGYLIPNIVLLSLIVLFGLFELITYNLDIGKSKRIVKRIFNWSKILIKTTTLGLMIYGMYLATTDVHPFSIIIATLMIIFWILQVLLEIVSGVIESKIYLVKAAFEKDMEDIKKPITTVSNVIKVIKGEEIKKPCKTSREIEILEEKIKKDKQKKKQKNKKRHNDDIEIID